MVKEKLPTLAEMKKALGWTQSQLPDKKSYDDQI